MPLPFFLWSRKLFRNKWLTATYSCLISEVPSAKTVSTVLPISCISARFRNGRPVLPRFKDGHGTVLLPFPLLSKKPGLLASLFYIC